MRRAEWIHDRRFSFDVTLACLVMALEAAAVLPGILAAETGAAAVAITMLVLQLSADAALAWRRKAPVVVLAVVVAVSIPGTGLLPLAAEGLLGVSIPDEINAWLPFAAPFAVYSAVAYAGDRRVSWLLTAGLTVLAVQPWQPVVQVVTAGLLFLVIPALLGLYVAARRRLLRALTDRAERAEREQHLLAERARTEERAKLTAEMHDVVSHRVSLMVLQASALKVTAGDGETRRAAEELRSAGCQALDELRDLIGMLRTGGTSPAGSADEPADVPPLAELVAQSASARMPITLDTTGNPDRVSPVVSRTAYRVVQEALTNARKHAPGARVRVAVEYGAGQLSLRVANGPASGAADPELASSGAGFGLAGLRQRVELIGGTLTAGAEPADGFTVEATLPNLVLTKDGGHGR